MPQKGPVYHSPIPLTIEDDGVEVDTGIDTINFDDNLTVTDEGDGKVSVSAASSDVRGDIYRVPFGYDSSAADEWLNYEHYNANCYEVPPKVIWDSDLIGISFTNKKSNARCIVEVYKNGTGTGQRVLQFYVDRDRWAYDTTITPISFSRGDTVRVYIRKWSGGDDADIPVVDLDFIITSNQTGSDSGDN
jgi:hypothetical protein